MNEIPECVELEHTVDKCYEDEGLWDEECCELGIGSYGCEELSEDETQPQART